MTSAASFHVMVFRRTDDLSCLPLTMSEEVRGKQDRTSVRLKTITGNDAAEVITLKRDKQYWPAYEIRRTEEGWQGSDIG